MTITSNNPNTATLLPGGSDPTVFEPLEAWYPIYFIDDLDQKKAQQVYFTRYRFSYLVGAISSYLASS